MRADALEIARAPHPMGDFIVISWSDCFCNEAGDSSVAETASSLFGIFSKTEFTEVGQGPRLRFAWNTLHHIQQSRIKSQFRREPTRTNTANLRKLGNHLVVFETYKKCK